MKPSTFSVLGLALVAVLVWPSCNGDEGGGGSHGDSGAAGMAGDDGDSSGAGSPSRGGEAGAPSEETGGTTSAGGGSTSNGGSGGDTGTGATGGTGGGGSGGTGGSIEPTIPAGCDKPLDPTVVTDFYEAMRCLFSGDEAVQRGVDANLIDPARISVLRGRVLDRDGQPLAGVGVSVWRGDDYGQTSSRADGYYDLAVNGGGPVTLKFEKSGFLPVQRRMPSEPRRFSMYPDIVMSEFGPATPTLVLSDLTEPVVLRGAVEADADGERQHRVLFRPDTVATALMPDGSMEPLDAITLRLTEFTVGELGPLAMPGELPATSAYTYAIDISTEEGLALGAASVAFDPPIPSYVDNFLGFPAGTEVPNGYFSYERDVWEAAATGVVLEILSVTDGLADIDVTGDGNADAASVLESFGIDEEERRSLADEYEAGASLWRTELPHLSTWDHNWPFSPPSNAKPPAGVTLRQSRPEPRRCVVNGSLIGCEDQSLGETFGIVGTPHRLHYQSERMPGRKDQSSLSLTFDAVQTPDTVIATVIEVDILGQSQLERVEGPPPSRWDLTWDGADAYGRTWQGSEEARVRVGFVYDGVYESTTVFGVSGNGVPITGDRARPELTLWSNWQTSLGGFSQAATGLGGWNFEVQHVLDADAGVLYLGSGSQRTAEASGGSIERVAGTGAEGFAGDGGPALEAMMDRPHGFVVRPDGAVLFCDYLNNRIRIITPDGTIDTFAGNGTTPSSGDGGPALEAGIEAPLGLALAPDGTVYTTDNGANTVRAIRPDGTIVTIAGGGSPSDGVGDGGSALEAAFEFPHELAYGYDGSIYLSDDAGNRVRRIAADGTISTFAGNGTAASGADGGLAVETSLFSPRGLVTGVDGSLYIAEAGAHKIRRVRPDGRIETVAGTGVAGFSGDGGPALEARLNMPHTLSLGPDGSLYFSDEENRRLRRIRPDGSIVTIAGNGTTASAVDGGSPLSVAFRRPKNVHVHNDGTIWIVDFDDHSLWRIRPAFPSFLVGETPIALDERQVAVFDADGRHLRTVDALLGTTLWSFEYDTRGRLSEVSDPLGLSTRIVRASDGVPEAIVGPYGATTELSFDGNGYLASIENPAGESVSLEYNDGGLLTAWTEPLDGEAEGSYRHEFSYDEQGRLLTDTSPSGFEQTLEREDLATGQRVTLRQSGARPMTYELQKGAQPTDFVRITTSPANIAVTSTKTAAGGTLDSPTVDATWTELGDPRFGNQAPYAAEETITWQSGTVTEITRSRSVTLEGDDPLALESFQESTTVNGAVYTVDYDRATRTLTTTSPLGRTAQIVFDDQGLPITLRSGTLAPVELTYDEDGRLVSHSVDEFTTSYSYGDSGYLASIQNALDQTVAFERDLAGRVIKQIAPDASELAFDFDANGQLVALENEANHQHRFEYAPGGSLTRYVAATVEDLSGSDWGFAYNEFDDPAAFDLGGSTEAVSFEYDAAARVASVDLAGDTATFGYESVGGRLSTAATLDVTLTHTYNGALPSRVTYSGFTTGTIDWLYDDNARLSSETVTGTTAVGYQYDADGLLSQAGALTFTRDADNGFVTASALGIVADTLSYNNLGELVDYSASVDDGATYERTDGYDALGRVSTRSETVLGDTHEYQYTYDSLGRLITVLRDGDSFEQYFYDARGNRSEADVAGSTAAGTYDAQDRLSSYGDASYEYTPAGQLLRRTRGSEVTEYTYDALGRLRSVALPDGRVIDYVLDAFGRRTGRTVDGELTHRWVYGSGGLPIADRGASGSTTVARYVFASAPHVPDYMLQGSMVYRIVTDALGSVRLVIDTTDGTIAQQLDYDSFGRVLTDTNPGFQPFGFAGGLYDPDTGLVRFGARDYDAEVGRWTSKDPILFAGGQANLYAYVGSDPVNLIDPSGLQSFRKYWWASPEYAQQHDTSLTLIPGTYTRSDGQEIQASMRSCPGSPRGDNCKYNCHGMTVGESQVYVGEEVVDILTKLGYRPWDGPLASGDVVIYFAAKPRWSRGGPYYAPLHSATVVSGAANKGDARVVHKPGLLPPGFATVDTAWPFESRQRFYRRTSQ